MKVFLIIGISLIIATRLVTANILSQPIVQPTMGSLPTPVTYPAFLADQPLDSVVDRWGMYNRECVSYTAWKVQSTFHDMPNWSDYGQTLIPDADNWVTLAQQSNIPVGTTPQVNSVAIAMPGTLIGSDWVAGPVGHSMWVNAVNPDGTILVSQYNLDDDGLYSTMTIPASGLTYIYFN